MSRPTQNLTGQRFGQLLVLSQSVKEFRGKRQSVCLCRCDCGQEKEVPVSALCRADGSIPPGATRSCGHTRTIGDISGQRFGRLTAVEPLPERNRAGEVVWRCRCDCGGEKDVSAPQLKSGFVRSCGCMISEKMQKMSALGTPASHTPAAEKKRIESRFGEPESQRRKAEGIRLRSELEKTGAIIEERSINIAKIAAENPEGNNPFRGVCWNASKQRWTAYCQVGKKRWASSRFRTPEAAKEARDKQLLLMLEAQNAEAAVIAWKNRQESKKD